MIRRDVWREYSRGSLWLLPVVAVVVSVGLGAVLSRINVSPDSLLAFQGTADDARNLLIGISSTMVTVIALLLGLAVVALQLSSTQFSPGCCATSCATGRTRSCSASSSEPSATARPGCSRSGVRRGAGDRVPAVRRHRRRRAAVPQPRVAGVLRRSPGPLDPGRPGHAGGRERHAGRDQEAADRRRAHGDAATRRARRSGAIVRIRAGHLRRPAASATRSSGRAPGTSCGRRGRCRTASASSRPWRGCSSSARPPVSSSSSSTPASPQQC